MVEPNYSFKVKNKIINLTSNLLWTEYLSKFSDYQKDIYFTSEYYSLYEKNGEGKAHCFVFENENDIAIYPFLINSINELGYDLDGKYYDIQGAYGYNGVLSNNYSLEFRNSFYSAFDKFCMENKIIAEFTRFHPILQNKNFSNGFLNIVKDRNTVFLDLSKSYDEIWANEYSSRNRNMIRKAQKKHFSICLNEQPDLDKIKSFVKIYQTSMMFINAEKYYYFNDEYFINTFKNLRPYAVLFEAVNVQNKVECAAIIFIFGIYAHYHLSGRIKGSGNSANNFILDEALKYAIKKGAKIFHFGGGTTSDENDPLLKFKSSFSKIRSEFFIGKKIHNEKIYNEVIKQWEEKNPKHNEISKNILLRYRNL